MSVNLLTIENIYNVKNKNFTDPEFAKETKSRKLHKIDDSSYLENDEMLIHFDKRSFMPNLIFFKSLN